MEVAGPLGTPLGLAQRKKSSSGWEARTSGFLSNSDSDRSVPAELGQESQAMSFKGMELRLPLELFMGFQAPCQTVCGICRFFQTIHGGVSDPSFLSSSTGLPSKSCPGIEFL